MPLLETKIYTIEDIYKLPEGKRAELIDGKIYYMAPPSTRHQEVVAELAYQISDYIKKKKGSCKMYFAPFAVYLSEKSNTYVEPDIAVVCDADKVDDRGCKGAPDWIIEVVSPSSISMDYHTKLFKYQNAGVREYWIVDPLKDRSFVYDFEAQDTLEYTFFDKVKVGIYEDLYIDFSKIL